MKEEMNDLSQVGETPLAAESESKEEISVTASDSIPVQEDFCVLSQESSAPSSDEESDSPSDHIAQGDVCGEAATSFAEGEKVGDESDDADVTAEAEGDVTDEGNVTDGEENFERQAEADMCELCALFPSLAPDGRALSLGELANPTRFAELRTAGLTVEEAFLASNYRMLSGASPAPDEGRRAFSHMKEALPRASCGARAMPTSMLVRTRTLFEGLSDRELTSLYRRVTE